MNDKERLVGDRIREERQRLELSQADLALKTGTHRKTIANYELGARSPDSRFLIRLSEIGINVPYVLSAEPLEQVDHEQQRVELVINIFIRGRKMQ